MHILNDLQLFLYTFLIVVHWKYIEIHLKFGKTSEFSEEKVISRCNSFRDIDISRSE